MSYFSTSSADDSDQFVHPDDVAFDRDWPADFDEHELELELDLEHSDLDRRLRELVWPSPPAGARERCLQAVLSARPVGYPPAPPVHPEPPGRQRPRIITEGMERYELSRRRTEPLGLRVLRAPRRELRFAAVL